MNAAPPSPLTLLLDPLARCLPQDVARQVAEVKPDPSAQARIDELAAKSSEGTLTIAEKNEYEAYVEAIDVVSIIQLKARKMLLEQIA